MPAIIVGTNMMTEATIKTYANVVIVFSNKSSCSDTCNVTTSPLLQIIGLDITAKFASFSRFIISLDSFVVNSPNKSRSEEHTSELQSRGHLVCRLLLEKKKNDETYLIVVMTQSIQNIKI